MALETKYRTCNLCEALCGLEIEVRDGVIGSIRGDKEDVLSKGHICPKAVALKDIHYDPDRLKRPVEKINGQWSEVTWEYAIHKAARSIVDIQNTYGFDAVGIYQGNPSVHNLGTALFAPQFARTLKTKNRFSATSVDQLGHHLAGETMFGHMNLMPVPDLDRTDFWLILGGNPMVSNGSIMTAPGVAGKIVSIKKRGGQVVVVDPRFTETAKKAGRHLFIQPGTDIFLILALIKTVFDKNAVRLGHLSDLINHQQLKEVQALLEDLSIEQVARATHIEAHEILHLADDFLSAGKAVCYGRLGVSAAINGGLNHWAVNFLNIITGNFDTPGGAMLPEPAIPVAVRKSKRKRFARWHSRVRQLPETGGELPAAAMAEEIFTEGEGQIRSMITSCGNPILSTPNGRQLDKAYEQLDFALSIDIYLNETSRHADLILPPRTGLETAHYGLAFHNLAVRNAAKYSEPVVEGEPGTKFDWEIYQELTRAIKKLRNEDGHDSNFSPDRMLEQGLAMGSSKLTMEDLRKAPHGIDLGPLTSNIAQRSMHESGQIDVFPKIYKEQLQDVVKGPKTVKSLLMIGRRDLRSNNSWMHNSRRLIKGKNRCTALIHPSDALKRGIEDGQKVVVQSRVGKVSLLAEITTDLIPGVISIPHGWGHDRAGIQLDVARTAAGVSMNDLVDDQVVDPLTGVAVINAVPVSLTAAEGQHANKVVIEKSN